MHSDYIFTDYFFSRAFCEFLWNIMLDIFAEVDSVRVKGGTGEGTDVSVMENA